MDSTKADKMLEDAFIIRCLANKMRDENQYRYGQS